MCVFICTRCVRNKDNNNNNNKNIDGMATIHEIHTMPSTFSQLVVRLLQDLMHMAIQCRCLRVDFVCDQYPVQNIKNCKRERRAMGGTHVDPHHKT